MARGTQTRERTGARFTRDAPAPGRSARFNGPRQGLATWIAGLAAIVIGTLLAAITGGEAGTRFHRKVDRVGLA